MTTHPLVADLVDAFKTEGRIVIVGASLAGLRAAEALRAEGFHCSLTVIGDEPHEPYDRPPLSKQVLKGWVPADHTKLPGVRPVDADWHLSVAATGLDRANRQVLLATGDKVGYDRLLIATGTRARPWFNADEGISEQPDRDLRFQAAFLGKPGLTKPVTGIGLEIQRAHVLKHQRRRTQPRMFGARTRRHRAGVGDAWMG